MSTLVHRIRSAWRALRGRPVVVNTHFTRPVSMAKSAGAYYGRNIVAPEYDLRVETKIPVTGTVPEAR